MEEGLNGIAVLWADSHANTGPYGCLLVSGNHERFSQYIDDLLGCDCRLLARLHTVRDHGKLVSADPGDYVRCAERGRNSRSDLSQHLITSTMPHLE